MNKLQLVVVAHTPVINETKKMRQEEHEFKTSLGYTFEFKPQPN
jgi:hypothetical protein